MTCLFTPHHVGIIVESLEAAMDAYITDFGYTFFQFPVNENNARLHPSSQEFRIRLAIGQLGVNMVELIHPVSGTTVYSNHLAEKGPGLHHLGFSVLDLTGARNHLEARGYPCIQNGAIHGLVGFSYYQAKDLGLVVEPLQISCELGASLLQNAQPYPG